VAAIVAPFCAKFMGQTYMIILLLMLAALILWKHRENIARLLKGTEPKIGKS